MSDKQLKKYLNILILGFLISVFYTFFTWDKDKPPEPPKRFPIEYDGDSWDRAFPSIQDAIEAPGDGKIVFVDCRWVR